MGEVVYFYQQLRAVIEHSERIARRTAAPCSVLRLYGTLPNLPPSSLMNAVVGALVSTVA